MKRILVFFGLLCVINLMCAQSPVAHRNGHDGLAGPTRSVSISASDVQFWVGSGSNSTLVCIGWDAASAPYTPTVVVWGIQWNGSITLLDALDSIATYDNRFTFTTSGSYLQTLDYNDPDAGVHLSPYQEWNCNSYGSVYGSTALNSTWLRISESTCDDYNFSTVNNLIYASDPNAAFSCLKAQSVSISDLTATSVTVNFTDTTYVNNYTVELLEGDSLIDSVVIYTQTISYTTLTANTSYTVKIFSNCLDGTQTSARTASFRTPCVEVAHSSLPWIEDFQSYNGMSYSSASVSFASQVYCWDLINPYSTSDPYINSSSSVNVSGGKCLYVSSRPSSPTILVLPPFVDTPDQLRLQFDVLSSYGHGFEAGVITDVTDESTFTPIATCTPTGSGWNHFEISFAGFTTGRIALRSNDNGPAYLDNVTVDEVPSCVKPSQVIVSNIGTYSADITITDPNSTNHYMVYAAEDSVEIYGSSYSLSGLSPNTRYVVGVRTICGDNTITNATEASFRTGCGPIAIPYHEDFSQFVDVANGYGNAVTDSTLPCWGFFKSRELDRLELFPYTNSYGYGEEGYTLRIYGNYANSIDILRLPELAQATNTLEVSFMARPSETGTFGGILEVGYMTDPTDTASFVAVASYACGQFTNGYDLCAATFANAPANAYIALRTVPTGGSAKSWYIDELDVHDMPACARANGISVDNITTDGFTLHVADPTTVNHYRYYITSQSFIDSTDFYDTVVVVTGLASSADFELSVVSICSDGALTLPHTISVSTLCAPVTVVPFVENFENWTPTQSSGMHRCWNRLYCNSSGNLVTNNYPYCASGSGNAYNGFKSLKMYSKGTSSAIKEYSVAYLPEFTANVNTLKVTFFYKYGGSTTNMNKVRIAVGISENVNDTTTFTRLATLTPSVIGWNEFEVEFSGYIGTGNRITIMQTSTGTTAITSYIDSLMVDTVSSCSRPATFEVSDISAYGATLTWTDPGTAESYILRWNDGAITDSDIVTNETTYNLTGLMPSTTYSVDIRSICWGEPTNARTLTFATSCAPMPLPWSMDFDNITNLNQLSSCWNRYSGLYIDSTHSATLSSTTSGWSRSTTAFEGSSHVKINLYGTSCKYWLVTPEIDLTENAELTFDYMLTAYNTTDAPQTGAGLEDDRFMVLATADNGTSWIPLAQWGSDTVNRDDYYLPAVTNSSSQAVVSLANLTGQVVRLAFYGESRVSGTDNDFRIDNIVVALAPDTTSNPDTIPTPPGPVDATIAAADIDFWVGTGNSEVIFVGNWCSPDVAFAWGVRFNGSSATVEAVMDTLMAYDYRFGYSGSGGIIYDVTYQDANYNLVMSQPYTGFIMYNVNGTLADFGYTDMYVSQGDLIKVGNTDCATMTGDPNDWTTMGYAWETPIEPVTPLNPPTPPMPEESTIDFSDILYWVGEGANQAVMAVNWADTALAWGYRWNGTATVADMMSDIAAADPRFSYELGFYGIDDILFVMSEGDTLRKVPYSYWESKNNGVIDMGMDQTLANNDFEKWAEPAAGIVVDSMEYGGYWYYSYVYQMTIYPVSIPDTTPVIPVPEESTIDFSDIIYWVGEGANQAVMAINWADTALAWGYRWEGTATVADMMADIAAADPRFSYELGDWGIEDILFVVAEGDTLRKVPYSYWESKNNGVSDAGMGQPLVNNDFEKWAEPAAGVVVDSMEYGGYWYYTYIYPMTIYPVSTPPVIGVGSHEMSRVYAYPNPCMGTLYIVNENAERIELYDMNGKLLEVVNSGETHSTLNMQTYSAGLYLLKVGNNVQKILKK